MGAIKITPTFHCSLWLPSAQPGTFKCDEGFWFQIPTTFWMKKGSLQLPPNFIPIDLWCLAFGLFVSEVGPLFSPVEASQYDTHK